MMHRIQDCVDTLQRYYPNADIHLVDRAYVYAAKMHRGQTRLSGEPYLSHPIEVALTLAELKMDAETITTGLLHDVLEDTEASYDQLVDLFGDEVAQLVEGVTKIEKINFGSREEYQAENLRKMLLAMAKDIRVLIVKLADRLHNVRTLKYAGEEQRKRVAGETLDIYAPLANRLGLGAIKAELEDHAFKYLEPEIYQQLIEYVQETQEEQQTTIDITRAEIARRLEEHGIEATISGRQKHLYGIYRKMRSKGISFKEVMDAIGLRVITNSKADCYSTLGIIHSSWKHIPNTFDDYITIPKPNMYQSLHTAVMGPFGKPVEIQIRTWEMHHLAEEGIAAHWRYKERKYQDDEYDQKFFSLRHIIEWHQELKDPSEFVEHLKIDLFPDEVYVFTPRGEVKCLPRGATPVDFAYSVHTEVGHRCAGAKINERLVPLRTRLHNGDIIEIITQKQHQPAKDWLSFVVTSRARAKIKHFFRAKEREEAIHIGTEMLEKALRKAGLGKLARLIKTGELATITAELGVSNEDDLLAALGVQKLTPQQVIDKLTPESAAKDAEPDEAAKKRRTPSKGGSSDYAIKVKGVDSVLTRFGLCCKPLPGDKIVGFITRGRGITVHTTDCPNMRALDGDDERKIAVEWDQTEGIYYPAELYIMGRARPSLFADIVSTISQANAEILNSTSETLASQLEVRCVINVLGRDHLNKIIANLHRVNSVLDVRKDGLTV
jgi:GTP diphosphokinase / guanosine-3',5'-bis(diphosphate) 3'-diphosphatase